jgi:hypothetical protein
MALTKDQPRGRTGCVMPIPRYTLAAEARRWYSGEVVGQDSDGIVYPLVPGLTPIGVSESSIDYSDLADGDKAIEVRSGQAIPLPQDGTLDIDAPIGTPVYWNGTANVATATDGGGAYAYCGPLVVCRSATTVEVGFEPERLVMFGGDVMIAKTITHADLTASALTQTIVLGVAPGRFIGGSKVLTAQFTGGGAASCTLDVGGTDVDGLIDADDVFGGTAGAEDFAPAGVLVVAGLMPNMADQTINAIFTCDVNVVLLTAGSVTLRLFFKRVP